MAPRVLIRNVTGMIFCDFVVQKRSPLLNKGHFTINKNGKIDSVKFVQYFAETRTFKINLRHSEVPDFFIEFDLAINQLKEFINSDENSSKICDVKGTIKQPHWANYKAGYEKPFWYNFKGSIRAEIKKNETMIWIDLYDEWCMNFWIKIPLDLEQIKDLEMNPESLLQKSDLKSDNVKYLDEIPKLISFKTTRKRVHVSSVFKFCIRVFLAPFRTCF